MNLNTDIISDSNNNQLLPIVENTNLNIENDDIDNENTYLDDDFYCLFIQKMNLFNDFDHLSNFICDYETQSKCKLRVMKSNSKIGFRLYACVQHLNCSFKASFGRRREDHHLILKKFNRQHTGVNRDNTASDGRRWKNRTQGRLKPSVAGIEKVKVAPPVPFDVIKARLVTIQHTMKPTDR